MHRRTWNRLIGSSGFTCLTTVLLLGPAFLSWGLSQGGASESGSEAIEQSRIVVGAEVLEASFSEGFREVVQDLARTEGEPTWPALRRIMEARGRTDGWYSYRVRWRLDDGRVDELGYTRKPYDNDQFFWELLEIAHRSLSATPTAGVSDPWRVVTAGLAERLERGG